MLQSSSSWCRKLRHEVHDTLGAASLSILHGGIGDARNTLEELGTRMSECLHDKGPGRTICATLERPSPQGIFSRLGTCALSLLCTATAGLLFQSYLGPGGAHLWPSFANDHDV